MLGAELYLDIVVDDLRNARANLVLVSPTTQNPAQPHSQRHNKYKSFVMRTQDGFQPRTLPQSRYETLKTGSVCKLYVDLAEKFARSSATLRSPQISTTHYFLHSHPLRK